MIFSLPVQRTGPEKGVKIMSDCSRSKRLQCGPRQQHRAAIRHDLLGACPYLNKIVEQDNPSDQKPAPMKPRVFRSFDGAWRTIQGHEVMYDPLPVVTAHAELGLRRRDFAICEEQTVESQE
jgi:hypothetical protein